MEEFSKGRIEVEDGWVKTVTEVPFTYLSLDIPPCPLFRDSHGGYIIPQVPLFQLLNKFDGETWVDHVTKEAHHRKRYRIKQLPRYLILHLARFTKNNFSLEKNPTIVTFPVRNLELKDYLYADEAIASDINKKVQRCPSFQDIESFNCTKLKEVIADLGSAVHKNECEFLYSGLQIDEGELKNSLLMIARRVVERVELLRSTKYDLAVNICHESESGASEIAVGDSNMNAANQNNRKKTAQKAGISVSSSAENDVVNKGSYKIHLPFKSTGQWYEMQDLRVNESSPQLIGMKNLSYNLKFFINCLLFFRCVRIISLGLREEADGP